MPVTRSIVCAAAFMFLLGSTALHARSPFHFYKASVDRQAFESDFAYCHELAGGVRAPQYTASYTNLYAVAASSFLAGFFGSRERRHLIDNVLRTCMADKGYRRVETSRETVKSLKRLDEAERVHRLFELASSPAPEGKTLPR